MKLNSCSSDSKTYLPKYASLHLTPLTLLLILVSPLTNIFSAQKPNNISLRSLLLQYHIRQLRCSLFGLISIPQLTVPLLPLLFSPSLITLILSTINSLSLNCPVSSRSRTLLLVSLKLLSPVVSLPSYALFTGSESPNASDKAPLTYLQSSHKYPTSIPS